MQDGRMLDLWYKNAVIYSLDVEVYRDGNGNGVGDFKGLSEKLDHISSLGATCVWLQPFFPSPGRDDGYDVMDYYGVDPRVGTLGDFVEFSYQAQERGLRILIDLVVNHTSDQHPWFLAARSDPCSPFRDFYVWSQHKPGHPDRGVVFPGHQDSVWSFDRKARAWYFHRFYKQQPDLNIDNPAVREEIQKIMGFWAQLGVSGFRIDAVPFLIQREGAKTGIQGDPVYSYLEEMREFLSWRRGDAVLLGEANILPREVHDYFGAGERMQLLFNFYANQHLFLSLATEDAGPLIKAYEELPAIDLRTQWANFLRNHDELDLGRLTDSERERVFAALSPDPDSHLYRRGIRRRLAPMLDNDRRHLELAYSLMFALPGTPVLRYGEEIGMGDDLSLPERLAVRTPMQWSAEAAAGFSEAPPETLLRPVIDRGAFSYRRVNVAAQQRDHNSLLNWMQRLIRLRRSCPELGWGRSTILETDRTHVFAHRAEWRGRSLVMLHNLAAEGCEVALPPEWTDGSAVEIFGDSDYGRLARGRTLRVEGYGYRWFRVGGLP
mgnify:CR=1 FL=1